MSLKVREHRVGAGPDVEYLLRGWRRRRSDFFALLAILAVTLSHRRGRGRALRPDAGFATIAHIVEPMVDLLRHKGHLCHWNVAEERIALSREEFLECATWVGAEQNQAQKVLHTLGWPARDPVEHGADPLFIAA